MTKTGHPADRVLALAADVLLRGEKEGAQLYSQLHASLEKCDLNGGEKAKVTALVTGVCKHLLSIDYIINLFSKTKTNKIKAPVLAALRLGVCELVFMDKTSDAHAVSSCVELVRERGLAGLTGYVNGVLRTVGRNREAIVYPNLSTRYSVPAWICRRLEMCFGDETEQILRYFEQEHAVTIRVDERLSAEEKDSLLQKMKASSDTIQVFAHPLLSYAYILERPGDIRKLPGFEEGAFFVQDAGAQLAVEIAGIKKGDTVIDVCAAPGGKSVHAYIKCRDDLTGTASIQGHLIAMDLTERKCDLIRQNAERLRAAEMEILAHDARAADKRFLNAADVVICDLPCSGLGILGRKADIRYRLREEEIEELAMLQKEILRESVSYLKEGGILLFSTCTLTREENEDNVRFIAESLGLEPVDIWQQVLNALQESKEAHGAGIAKIPTAISDKDRQDFDAEELLSRESLRKGYLTLPPGRFLTDGFFMAKFRKLR